MDIEKLKKDLQEVGYVNLITNDGSHAERIKEIKNKLKIANTSNIVACINRDLHPTFDLIVVTEEGIQWSGFVEKEVNGKNRLGRKGVVSFKELSHFKCSVKKNMLDTFGLRLENMDIAHSSFMDVLFEFQYNSDLNSNENAINAELEKLQKVFEILIHADGTETSIPDECNGELIRAFIGDNDYFVTFYKKAFSKYTVNGIDKFAFVFSWFNALFGVAALFDRKLYKEALIGTVIAILAILLDNTALFAIVFVALIFVGGFITSYLVFKRYKKTLNQCNAKGMDYEQKLKTLESVGGTNKLVGILVLVLFILGIIRSCME